jgi:membrane protein implicated in regulation of membrane protease activity
MASNATARRRWLGILFLGCAALMLVAGQTILQNCLRDLAFLAYWIVCFGFTGLAVAVALLDARANRHRLRDERRALLQTTLKDIQSAAQKRQRAKGKQDTN